MYGIYVRVHARFRIHADFGHGIPAEHRAHTAVFPFLVLDHAAHTLAVVRDILARVRSLFPFVQNADAVPVAEYDLFHFLTYRKKGGILPAGKFRPKKLLFSFLFFFVVLFLRRDDLGQGKPRHIVHFF